MGFFDIFSGNQNNMNRYAIDIARGVEKRINSIEVAKQFVLEELDAASQGNEVAMRFVKNSGISENEYKGAMGNSFEEVDGADGPQQFILISCMQLGDMDLMVETRIQVVDYIMKQWNLGRYNKS